MLKTSGTVLVLVILGFFLNPVLHIPVSWVALVGAVVMLLVTDSTTLKSHWKGGMDNSHLRRSVCTDSLITTLRVISWIGDQVESAISGFDPDYQFVAALGSFCGSRNRICIY